MDPKSDWNKPKDLYFYSVLKKLKIINYTNIIFYKHKTCLDQITSVNCLRDYNKIEYKFKKYNIKSILKAYKR